MNVPLTRVQKLIGDKMLKSKLSKPCFYIEMRADVTELMALRGKLKSADKPAVRITTNAFYIRALALAAQKFPLMVGTLIPFESVEIAESINVGFAVHAPIGLVAPVIKDAGKKTLEETARLEKLLTEKALSSKLTLQDIEGQTIGLSNLGVFGIDSFIGIVPPTTTTLLAVGNVIRTPVLRDGQIDIRKMISLSLAVDRMVVSEPYAAKFLAHIAELLQNPHQLV